MKKLQILQSVYNELGAGYGFNGSEKKALYKINELIQPLIDKALSDAFVAGKSKQSFADFKSEWERIEWYKFTPPEDPAPPSSPTATAEEVTLKWAKYQIAKKYGYETWTAVSFYAIDAMAETTKPPYAEEALNDEVAEFYASLKEQEAHNRAVQECIDIIKDWYENERALEGKDFYEELEKLKG